MQAVPGPPATPAEAASPAARDDSSAPTSADVASHALDADEEAGTATRKPAAPPTSERAADGVSPGGASTSRDGSNDASGGDSHRRGGDEQRPSLSSSPSASSRSDAADPFAVSPTEAEGATPMPDGDPAAAADAPEATPEVASARATTGPASTPGTRTESVAFPRPILSAAWLQKLGEVAPQAAAGTWHVVQLSLGEGDGDLTVRARRDEDRVHVSVGFSDPQLRALASDQADRLQSALEARYGADVDLSFTDGEGREPEERGESHATRPGTSAPSDAESAAPSRAPAHSRPGTHHEWIG